MMHLIIQESRKGENIMKKLTALLLISALSVGTLVGCGSSDAAKPAEGAQTAST